MTRQDAGAERSAPVKPIPARIKEAREARGFTLESFAEALGVTKQAVAQYETGQISPNGSVMDLILRLTEQPPSFFRSQRFESSEIKPFWRSLNRMDLRHRTRVARRLAWAGDVVRYLEQFIDLPRPNIPAVEFDYLTDDADRIESIAELIRDHWGLGREPITDLMGILEVNGITVIEEAVNCADMDAVSCWQDGRPYILLAAEDVLGPRKNYNLAHELGHLVLHALVELDAKLLKRIEAQADRFASAFLMPQETFGQEVLGTSLSYFIGMKRRWNVAIAAIAVRSRDLSIIDKQQLSYLFRQMNARNIRKKEPLDEEIMVAKPAILSHAMGMLIEHGVQTKGQVIKALALSPRDIEALCGLAAGYLQDNVVVLRPAITLRST